MFGNGLLSLLHYGFQYKSSNMPLGTFVMRLDVGEFGEHFRLTSDSDSDSDRGLFNIKLHTKVLHQVYIAKQYEHFEQIWTWHNKKYLLGDLY